jgi:hypothetical protein
MSPQMTKRPYSPPRVVRVRLAHEQAVLSACSTTATTVSAVNGLRCSKPIAQGGNNCKKQSSGSGVDSTNTS